MNTPTVFDGNKQILAAAARQLTQEGQEFNLRGVTMPHFAVKDTALAACLATLDIPFRDPAPFTDDVGLDDKGNECSRTKVWWLGDVSRAGGAQAHKTEELIGAWIERERFEKEHPMHQLVAMRAAIDARAFWLQAIHTHKGHSAILPVEVIVGKRFYATQSINGAAVLKACGFQPLAFNGSHFFLEAVKDGVAAEAIVLQAALHQGATDPQWMSRALFNYSHLLKIAKEQPVIIRQRVGPGQTLILSADASAKTRDKFHALI